MSNVSSATPYEQTVSEAGSTSSSSPGTAEAARWLTAVTEEERELRATLREARARAALGAGDCLGRLSGGAARPLKVHAATLHARQIDPLLRSAARLGFRQEMLAGARANRALGGNTVLLTGPQGERLSVTSNPRGRVVLRATDERHIQQLVKQHTLDRVVTHLRNRGADVTVAALPTGGVQLTAQEAERGQRDGRAQLRAQVTPDGGVVLDVSGVRGPRCREFVESVTHAADCAILTSSDKDEMFQMPGESTFVRERI